MLKFTKWLATISLPLIVAGCAASPTPVQLWQEGKAPLSPTYNYFGDTTLIAPSTTYVRLAEIGFTVDKPFPDYRLR